MRWKVLTLAVAVAASSALVPFLVDETPDPTPTAQPIATPTTPLGTTTTPAPVRTTLRPRATPTRRPSSSPSPMVFRPFKIAASAKGNARDGVKVTDCLTCLSGSRVQYLGQGHTLVIPLPKVEVAGRRTLTVVYTCGCADAPRTLDLRVNDDDPRSLTLKGAGGWDDPAKTTLHITLRKGSNQILFYNNQDPAPDLDRIEIT